MAEPIRTKYKNKADKALENLTKIVDEIDKNLLDKSKGPITQQELDYIEQLWKLERKLQKISSNAENNLLKVMRKQKKRRLENRD